MELEVKRLQKVMQNKILVESLQFCPKAKDGPQRLVFTRPYPQTRPKDGLHPSKPNPVCKRFSQRSVRVCRLGRRWLTTEGPTP